MRAKFIHINEDLLGVISNPWYSNGNRSIRKFEVFKNPRSIKRMGESLRAISDKEGNLYVVDDNGEWLIHGRIRDWLEDKKFIKPCTMNIAEDGVRWQRLDDTDDFYLAESYSEMDVMNYKLIFKKLTEKVKQKNPQYNFILQSIVDYYINLGSKKLELDF
jgi:hypothetical protein